MATSQKIPVDWEIKNLDTKTKLIPPYPVMEDGLSVSIGGILAEQPRFGFQDPITQWVGGKTRVVTFRSMLYAVDTSETIVAKFKQIEKLAVKDKTLGRGPICIFTLGSGSLFSETVLVESVDVDVPPIRPDGEPRQIIVSFVLKRYKPFSLTQIDPTKSAKESYFLVATAAEATYEAIAKRFYGNPLLGDRLRKRHPRFPLRPEVGKRVKIPAKSIIVRETVEPTFPALNLTNDEAVARFEETLDERNQRKAVI